jgi:predicted O-linked N-acetylglucosamine transferase (SPINDLY family)
MIRPNQQSFHAGDLLARAIEFHQAGNLGTAQSFYGQILKLDPNHFNALHLLGVLRHQQGRNQEAHALISSAHALDPASAEALSDLGVVLQALERHEEAIAAYDRLLAIQPRHAETLNNRGLAMRALNRPAAAAMCFDRAIAIRPDYADAHHNRADLMCNLGRAQEAIASYDQAIALQPEHFKFHRGRGRALRGLRDLVGALESYRRAVTLRPDDADVLLEHGVVLSELGRHQEALDAYNKVLEVVPDHLPALNNRGGALEELGRVDEAEASFAQALALAPADPKLHGNRGAVLQRSQRFEEALVSFDRALAIRPNDANTLSNRGNALLALRRYREALESYDCALAIAPNDVRALNNRATALNEIKMHQEALATLDKAIAIAPDYAEAHYNRGNAYKGMKHLAEALSCYEEALSGATAPPFALGGYAECAAKLCDWARTAQIQAGIEDEVLSGQSIIAPFTLLGYQSSPALQLACARKYTAHTLPALPPPLHGGAVRSHDRIRVAYLSANFNRHAMSYLMVNLFERHDRSKFEITGISFGPDDASDIRSRVVAALDHFHDVRDLNDRDVAKLMCDLEIDIAVDIMGYTHNARPGILWHRPAPIQVSYLGYAGTMGADFIDYIITDPVVVPAGEERFYAEKVVRLPDCYLVNDSRRPISERTPSREEVGLPERGFVFCCFNNSYKITAEVFDVWMRLLAAIDGSVLWLLRDENSADHLKQAAAAHGVDPARLVFADHAEQADHLARLRLADLFLDTLPYNAHTTCSDALWAGAPVLTCRGDALQGRVAASLLLAVGLPELVTSSLTDYAALALWLARDPALLGEIRKRLAENRLSHPLFDTDLSRRHIEIAYTTMWRMLRRAEGPKSFKVEAGHEIESAPDGRM